jgi:hypothetical protein
MSSLWSKNITFLKETVKSGTRRIPVSQETVLIKHCVENGCFAPAAFSTMDFILPSQEQYQPTLMNFKMLNENKKLWTIASLKLYSSKRHPSFNRELTIFIKYVNSSCAFFFNCLDLPASQTSSFHRAILRSAFSSDEFPFVVTESSSRCF